MAYISLKEITDDILLLVRNNNISESEDLSRAQIHSWIRSYRHMMWREEKNRRKDMFRSGLVDINDLIDDEFIKKVETGPHELEEVESLDDQPIFTKRIKEPLVGVLDNSESNILAVHDQEGENIQYMNHIRRHYNYWRRYTFGEMTAFYKDDGHVYILGLTDMGNLKYVYILWLKEIDEDEDNGEDPDNSPDEDDIMIPAWMVPGIKERIIKNELSFMLRMPSDDDNNATLDGIKPDGPREDEK